MRFGPNDPGIQLHYLGDRLSLIYASCTVLKFSAPRPVRINIQATLQTDPGHATSSVHCINPPLSACDRPGCTGRPAGFPFRELGHGAVNSEPGRWPLEPVILRYARLAMSDAVCPPSVVGTESPPHIPRGGAAWETPTQKKTPSRRAPISASATSRRPAVQRETGALPGRPDVSIKGSATSVMTPRRHPISPCCLPFSELHARASKWVA